MNLWAGPPVLNALKNGPNTQIAGAAWVQEIVRVLRVPEREPVGEKDGVAVRVGLREAVGVWEPEGLNVGDRLRVWVSVEVGEREGVPERVHEAEVVADEALGARHHLCPSPPSPRAKTLQTIPVAEVACGQRTRKENKPPKKLQKKN